MEWRCEPCQKEFTSKEGLDHHNQSKHNVAKPQTTPFVWKKGYTITIVVVLLLGLGVWGITNIAQKNNTPAYTANLGSKLSQIPTGQVHWHPHLTIKINGNNVPLPSNIGLSVGQAVDTQLGMDRGMAPTHTHEPDGIIHIETLNARAKPEVFTLGYFFYVWEKQFSSTCIFEYCTDKGTLRMTVNGKENTEFDQYVMHNDDQIIIEYNENKT